MKTLSDSPGSGPRIAVVEEGPENIYSIRFILQSLGYDVASYSGDRDFLDRLVEFQPAVVLVDMLMPAETGLWVLTELKRRRGGFRVLAVTADAVPWTEDQLRAAGADDVLAKPYDVSDLQRLLSGA